MGFWSKVKKVAKKVWKKVKAVARTIVRIVVIVIGRILGLGDLIFGFFKWPSKKLRLHIVILTKANGKTTVNISELDNSIEYARRILKEKFNVKMKPYKKEYITIVEEPAPSYALTVDCDFEAFKEEYGDAGDFFSNHVVGWKGIPVSFKFPITAFIVEDVVKKKGCALGPLTDYLTLDPPGVKTASTLAHEIGHSCGLWHSGTTSNIMFKGSKRGAGVKWFQKNLLRSSRHVMYW